MTGRFVTLDRTDDISPYVERVLEIIGNLEAVITDESLLQEFLDPKGFDQRVHSVRPGMHQGWKIAPGDTSARLSNEAVLKAWSDRLGFVVSAEDTFVLVAKKLRSFIKT